MATKKFCNRTIKSGKSCLVLDGAMGTTLSQAGLTETEAWTAGWRLDESHIYDATKTAHLQFLNSGVDILTANTYRVYPESVMMVVNNDLSRTKDSDYDYAGHVTKWTVAGIDLANECIEEFMNKESTQAEKRPILAVSIATFGITIPGRTETTNRIYDEKNEGIYNKKGFGASLSSIENYFNMRLSDEIISRVRTYGNNHNDSVCFAFETCGDKMECQAICNVLGQKSSLLDNIDTWITFTCPTGDTVDSGDSLKSCVEVICKCQYVTALGINCSAPALVLPLLDIINKTLSENNCSDKVVVVYPNSGERYIARKLDDGEEEQWRDDGDTLHDHSFEDACLEWIRNGANIVGGCCRITHKDIGRLVDKIDAETEEQ